jgi:hypothetical protein
VNDVLMHRPGPLVGELAVQAPERTAEEPSRLAPGQPVNAMSNRLGRHGRR